MIIHLALLVGLALASITASAFGADSGASDSSAAAVRYITTPMTLAFAIAYLSRRRAIGGWLFCYYFQLFGGALILVATLPFTISNLQYSDHYELLFYLLLIASVVLPFVVSVTEIALASRLLAKRQRNAKNVSLLRKVLVASVVINALAAVYDYHFAKEMMFLSVPAALLSLLWYAYFDTSYRVAVVFDQWDGTWNYESFAKARGERKAIRI